RQPKCMPAMPSREGRRMGRRSIAVLVAPFLIIGARARGENLRNTAPGVRYLGSVVCAGCHEKIFRDYRQTPMGRSMSTVSAAAVPLTADQVIAIGPQSTRRFEVFRDVGSVYQSESETGVFQTRYKLEYAVGSGSNGYTYIVRRA